MLVTNYLAASFIFCVGICMGTIPSGTAASRPSSLVSTRKWYNGFTFFAFAGCLSGGDKEGFVWEVHY